MSIGPMASSTAAMPLAQASKSLTSHSKTGIPVVSPNASAVSPPPKWLTATVTSASASACAAAAPRPCMPPVTRAFLLLENMGMSFRVEGVAGGTGCRLQTDMRCPVRRFAKRLRRAWQRTTSGLDMTSPLDNSAFWKTCVAAIAEPARIRGGRRQQETGRNSDRDRQPAGMSRRQHKGGKPAQKGRCEPKGENDAVAGHASLLSDVDQRLTLG